MRNGEKVRRKKAKAVGNWQSVKKEKEAPKAR